MAVVECRRRLKKTLPFSCSLNLHTLIYPGRLKSGTGSCNKKVTKGLDRNPSNTTQKEREKKVNRGTALSENESKKRYSFALRFENNHAQHFLPQ